MEEARDHMGTGCLQCRKWGLVVYSAARPEPVMFFVHMLLKHIDRLAYVDAVAGTMPIYFHE